jgi:hypothetical protein
MCRIMGIQQRSCNRGGEDTDKTLSPNFSPSPSPRLHDPLCLCSICVGSWGYSKDHATLDETHRSPSPSPNPESAATSAISALYATILDGLAELLMEFKNGGDEGRDNATGAGGAGKSDESDK